MKTLFIIAIIASLTGCQTVTDETGTHRRYVGPGVSVTFDLGGADLGFSIARPLEDASK
jgi:hypothetical protein